MEIKNFFKIVTAVAVLVTGVQADWRDKLWSDSSCYDLYEEYKEAIIKAHQGEATNDYHKAFAGYNKAYYKLQSYAKHCSHSYIDYKNGYKLRDIGDKYLGKLVKQLQLEREIAKVEKEESLSSRYEELGGYITCSFDQKETNSSKIKEANNANVSFSKDFNTVWYWDSKNEATKYGPIEMRKVADGEETSWFKGKNGKLQIYFDGVFYWTTYTDTKGNNTTAICVKQEFSPRMY